MAKMPPHVMHHDLGRWSYLSFDGSEKNPAIRIGIYEPNVEALSFWAKKLSDDLYFESDLSRGFGIDRIIESEGVEDGYRMLRLHLGRWRSTNALGEAMSELLSLLSAGRNLMGDAFAHDKRAKQLLEVHAAARTEVGAAIGGYTSPVLRRWVEEKHPSERLPAIEDAMRAAWNALAYARFVYEKREDGPNTYPFSAHTADYGGFIFDTCGNACDVSTVDRWTQTHGEGHRLGCHNLDSSLQQLSLLAGLAAFDDMARSELDPRPP